MIARTQLKKLWPRYRFLPALPLIAWAGFVNSRGMLRVEHIVLALLVLAFAYIGPRTRRFLAAVAGFIGVGCMFDAMRFVKNVGLSPERILLCDLHGLEQRWFGINIGGQRLTVHDYFFVHHTLVADILFAVPYGAYIGITIGYAIYLFVTDARACTRYTWTFFLLNVAGFITYHVLPAAPPWYFHTHGCAVDLSTPAFEGAALARVDAALGIPYFRSLYARSSDVFGAIPSLHVAYPLLIVWESFRRHGWVARTLALAYAVWMCTAAVYLDHHWFTDIIVGWLYAAMAVLLMTKLMPRSPFAAEKPL